MTWRNPKQSLPGNRQTVWVIRQHKHVGAPGCEILCGETNHYPDGSVVVENHDDIGLGWQHWILRGPMEPRGSEEIIWAWCPVEEIELPDWKSQ